MIATSQLPSKTLPPKPHRSTSTAVIVLIVSAALLGINLTAGLLLTNTSQEAQVLSSHLEALNRNRRNLEKLETDLVSYTGKISQLNSALPKESDIPEFIQFITETAQTVNSTAVLNFTSNQPTLTKDKLSAIPFSLQLTTTTANLLGFLSLIHQNGYQLRFEHIDADIPALSTSPVQARLTGKLYVSDKFLNSNP